MTVFVCLKSLKETSTRVQSGFKRISSGFRDYMQGNFSGVKKHFKTYHGFYSISVGFERVSGNFRPLEDFRMSFKTLLGVSQEFPGS